MPGLRRRPAAVVPSDRRRPPALRRLWVDLLRLRLRLHDGEAERVIRYSVSSSFCSRSCYSGGGKTSIPEHDGTAGAAVAGPAAALRYSVSSGFADMFAFSLVVFRVFEHKPILDRLRSPALYPTKVAPLTPRQTGSGKLSHHHPLSPGEASAAEAYPGGTGARSGPRLDRAASAAGRHSHPAAGRAGGAAVPHPRRLASRGVRSPAEVSAKLARSQREASAKSARSLRMACARSARSPHEARAKPAQSRREAWACAGYVMFGDVLLMFGDVLLMWGDALSMWGDALSMWGDGSLVLRR